MGVVAVDSGMLRIIDPCYTPLETYNERLEANLFPRPDENKEDFATPVRVEPIGVPCGLDMTGWGGDGVFGVFANVDDRGMVRSVTIEF